MTNALIDQNNHQSMIGRLNTDGLTVTKIDADPSTHALSVDNGTTGTDHGGTFAATDENGRVTLFAESSAGDGALVAVYVSSSGELLIDST